MIRSDLTNDDIYRCIDCEEIFQVFSQSGTTNFCPSCASRDIEGVDEEQGIELFIYGILGGSHMINCLSDIKEGQIFECIYDFETYKNDIMTDPPIPVEMDIYLGTKVTIREKACVPLD